VPKLFSTEHTYRHPWSHVTSAFWRKYPNPLATHVKEIDCYDRKLISASTFYASAAVTSASTASQASSSACSSRTSSSLSSSPSSISSLAKPAVMSAAPPPLAAGDYYLLVTNRLVACESPIPSWMSQLGFGTKAYATETCVVDPVRRTMTIRSRNLTGSSLMTAEETCTYSGHNENSDWTHYAQEAKVTAFMPFVSSSLESFGVGSMPEKSRKGLQAIEILCNRIKSEGLDSINSLSDAFGTFANKLHAQAQAVTGLPLGAPTGANAASAKSTAGVAAAAAAAAVAASASASSSPQAH